MNKMSRRLFIRAIAEKEMFQMTRNMESTDCSRVSYPMIGAAKYVPAIETSKNRRLPLSKLAKIEKIPIRVAQTKAEFAVKM